MEMTDISVKNNEEHRRRNKNWYDLCSNALSFVLKVIFVIGLTTVSLYSYLKITEQKEKIQQLDAELQNISNWSRTRLELITILQEKIDRLAIENNLIGQRGETNLNLTNLYRESQLKAQEKIQQLDAELQNITKWSRTTVQDQLDAGLQNISNWSRTRLELIPTLQEKIDRLAIDDNLIRQMGEGYVNLTDLTRESQLEAQDKIQQLHAELQNITHWSRIRLEHVQDKIELLTLEGDTIRQRGETNSNLTNLNRELHLEAQEKIQQLDGELQNISNASRTSLELISTMQEKIDRLAMEDDSFREMEETNSNLTNLNRELLLEAQEKIQQLGADIQNITNWSKTRLEHMQDKIDLLVMEGNLTRQMEETYLNRTILNRESQIEAQEKIQQLDTGLQNISNWLDLISTLHEEKIQHLDAELQNVSNWSRSRFELIPATQEKIANLATKDELIWQIEETNSNLTNLNRESQLKAQRQIQQLDVGLQNISNWSRTRLELIPTMQEKIAHLAIEDKLIRQMEETNRNLTNLNRESQVEAQKRMQEISTTFQNQIGLLNANLLHTIISAQHHIKLRHSALNQTYCLEVVNDTTVGMRPCQKSHPHQSWLWTKTGEIQYGKYCLGFDGTNVTYFLCQNRRSQQWSYSLKENSILHRYYSKKCLSVSDSKKELLMESCDSNIERQRWSFEIFSV